MVNGFMMIPYNYIVMHKTAQVSDETRSLGLVVARGTSEQPSVHDVSCRFHAFSSWALVNW